ncbi:MAG: UTP--glucose-1-phosphate uridylyltransferase [Actinobacteria bacterium]|nr:MAG: UTP--glucose-1-phosphate uridylyltransferase [Actinomycetota bacterium]
MVEAPQDQRPLRKAVIPVAGLGTRFLPATKALPKEMLPVVDRPAIQYVVEEAVAAGLDDLLLITGRSKTSLEDHFDRRPYLEELLEAKVDYSRAALVQEPATLGHMFYVRQGEPLGLGHAVLQAAGHVGDNPFAVLLGDDLVDVANPVLPRMAEVRAEYGGSVLLLMEVSDEQISAYGCAAVEPTEVADVVRVTGLIEKPPPGTAPSNLAVIGRYVLDPAVFGKLERTEPGRGGEIQLTDALEQLIDPDQPGGGMHAVVFSGRRYDTGDKLGYLKAVIELALRRPDLGPGLRAWLAELHDQGELLG